MPRWTAIALLLLPPSPAAQEPFLWQRYTTSDGLPHPAIRTVSLGQEGAVWLNHDEIGSITRFDGYQFRTLDFPGDPFSPIREGKSGQLWAVDSEGLRVRMHGRWRLFALPLILQEYRNDLSRRTRPVSLVPLRMDQALVLVSDRLFRFDASARATQVIRHVDATGLGRFGHMLELSDGSLCVVGDRGVAFLEGAVRSIGSGTAWRELEAPPGLQPFQKPVENPDGSISMVASDQKGRRLIATATRQGWSLADPEGARIRHGWKDSVGGYWGLAYHALYRISEGRAVPQDLGPIGLHLDVAVRSPDQFLVAGLDGLLRHSPSCWQRPGDAPDSPVHDILEDGRGHLWFLGDEALLEKAPDGWRRHPWPGDPGPLPGPRGRLALLGDGSLLIGRQDSILAFEPRTGDFAPVPGATRILGRDGRGRPLLLTLEGGVSAMEGRSLAPLQAAGLPSAGQIRFLVPTMRSGLVLGDASGIGRIEKGRFRRFGPEEGLPPGPATALVERGDGRLWAALGTAVCEFDGKRWTRIHQARERITGMLQASDQSLWAGSEQGLHRFLEGSWTLLGPGDGLGAGTVHSVLEDRGGRIWIATPRGVRLHVPQADIDPPRTRVRIQDRTAYFEARDRWEATPQERLLFSWRLDEGPWSPYGPQARLDLEDLPSGPHRLQVRAMDRNWNVEPIPAEEPFSVTLPWHRDPRLLIISCLALALVAFLSFLAVNRHLRLARSHAEVEREIERRTEELARANQELLQTQKMRALGTLTAGIAHDFNGILSIIGGSTQIIEANLDDRGKVLTRLERIRQVVAQGSGVIRSLLGLASSGRHPARMVSVGSIMQTVCQLADPLPVRRRCAPGLPPARLSSDLLQQMLLNLVSNAGQALEEGGTIRLEADLASRLPDDLVLKPGPAERWIRIQVVDDGRGIEPGVLPRIFEPFYSGQSLSSRRGTGLGLFMVYEMARELKAGLGVSSKPGTGTRFAILIPLPPAQEAGS